MTDLIDDTVRHRFEIHVGGGVAFVDYAVEGGRLVLGHTKVPPALEGRGVGSTLVRAVLDEARARGMRVVSRCSFVTAYIHRHPDYADLLVRGG
ncbi:GNAT family N-acetyltransferase [Gluconacetobacter tumulisoli]|uniref:N-acetyltransferase n=1 Tax=Gluconacetobacter tumulisoli TaxID=1286189 RepID=A0A7W4K5F2_9PROT|nr:GNAT family N-acetyltransferase [Gluconacetobacter tumulisoli]MBB2200520.1 N-acetyltransferase [Gluconacetobacter tumulisoli]